MPHTHNHDDFQATEPFETPRNHDHDDFEDNQSSEGLVTDPGVPTFVLRAGLGDPRGAPVSLSHLIYGLFLLANRCRARCPALSAHVVPRKALSSGCFPASIALVAVSPVEF